MPVSRHPRVGDLIGSTRVSALSWMRGAPTGLIHPRRVDARRVVVPDGRDLEVTCASGESARTPCASPPGKEEVPPGAGAGPRPRLRNRFRKAPPRWTRTGGVRGCY